MKTAKVNCEEHYGLCREAGIRSYPTIRFYPGALREGMSQVLTELTLRLL